MAPVCLAAAEWFALSCTCNAYIFIKEMHPVTSIVLLACIALHHAKELMLRPADNKQAAQNNVASSLGDNSVNILLRRALKATPVHHADLELMMLGKSGHLSAPQHKSLRRFPLLPSGLRFQDNRVGSRAFHFKNDYFAQNTITRGVLQTRMASNKEEGVGEPTFAHDYFFGKFWPGF